MMQLERCKDELSWSGCLPSTQKPSLIVREKAYEMMLSVFFSKGTPRAKAFLSSLFDESNVRGSKGRV